MMILRLVYFDGLPRNFSCKGLTETGRQYDLPNFYISAAFDLFIKENTYNFVRL